MQYHFHRYPQDCIRVHGNIIRSVHIDACSVAKFIVQKLSRIISIVDAYDAMVNDRCYRKALSSEYAMKEIRDNAGTQFDPNMARVFLELLLESPELALG